MMKIQNVSNVSKMCLFGFVVISFAVALQSCSRLQESSYNENGLLVKRTYYEDGTLQTECTFSNDTIRHGYSKLFYRNGREQWSIEYINGKKDGQEIRYFKNGRKQMVAWNKADNRDSIKFEFDSLGRSTEIEFWKRGKRIGEQLSLYPDGRLKACWFFDPIERLVFYREYDSTGTARQQGHQQPAIVVVTSEHSPDKWRVGEQFKARIYISRCQAREKWAIGLVNVGTGEVEDVKRVPENEVYLNYSKNLEKKGVYQISIFNENAVHNEFEFSVD
jgi:hypothetical protein